MKKILERYFSLVKNLFPEKRPAKPYIGLDIGTYSCKLIELIPTKNSFEILNWAIEPIGSRGVIETIKALLKKTDIQAKNVVTSVAGQGTLIRYIEMLKMNLNDAKLSFSLEADKYFPFVKDQIFTDCFIVDTERPDNKMSLIAVAAKKEIIEQRVQLLSSLGLDADYIGVNSIAIANIFNTPGVVDDKALTVGGETVALLDIGHSLSSLIILHGNLPFFTRDIFIGGGDFDKSISNILGVTKEAAGELKCQPADRAKEVLGACEAILMNLSAELRLSFDYFATERNFLISKLYLTGGGSLLQGIEEILSKNLDIPIERWNPIQSLKLMPGVSEEEINKKAPFLSVALGLSLYQYD